MLTLDAAGVRADLVNRQVVEADDGTCIALDGSVIESALRTVHELRDVDHRSRKIGHG